MLKMIVNIPLKRHRDEAVQCETVIIPLYNFRQLTATDSHNCDDCVHLLLVLNLMLPT